MKHKKEIITIAGKPGSGKSTAAKGVAEQLGFMHFSSGDLFRALAKEQGIDVLQANLAAEEEEEIPRIDYLVDERLREIGKKEDQIVIDSRMAWHWIPQSYKVFLDLDLETAAARILGKMTPERIEAEHIPSKPAEYARTLQKRLESEERRYRKIYGVQPLAVENYDLVLNTRENHVDVIIDKVINGFKEWLSSK